MLSYIEAHPPAGGTRCTCGAGSDRKRLVIQYKWPNVSGVLTHRRLTVVLAKAARGRTGVLVDVQEVWIVPRAASYVIPATAKVLELTVAWPELGPDRPETLLSTTVTEAAKVSAIVDAIDKMSLVQPGPGTEGCPPGPSGDRDLHVPGKHGRFDSRDRAYVRQLKDGGHLL